jgi:hypothetical protein
MNRILVLFILIILTAGCGNNKKVAGRISVARAGDAVLYIDQIPFLPQQVMSESDSTIMIQSYINKWAKRELLFQKAEENISAEFRDEIDKQLEETRANLVIYQYQRQMMLERMDTLVTDAELEKYYTEKLQSFALSSNIIKALFIKLPAETPDIMRIKQLARSVEQTDFQQLESICYQFAEKFDDFDEKWVPLNRLSVELPEDIENEENFLRRTTFYEASDSAYVYLISLRDYRLRSTTAPFEYVKDDIKRIIWNSRRIEFIQNLENGIYNDALKENNFVMF